VKSLFVDVNAVG